MYDYQHKQEINKRIATHLQAQDPYSDPVFVDELRRITLMYGDGAGGLMNNAPTRAKTQFARGQIWSPQLRHQQPAFESLSCTTRSVRLHLDAMMADAPANVTSDGYAAFPAVGSQAESSLRAASLLASKLSKQVGQDMLYDLLRLKILEGVEAVALANSDFERMLRLIELWGLCLFGSHVTLGYL